MRQLFLIILLSVGMTAFAQESVRRPVDATEKQAVLKQMDKRVESFTCHFTEEKRIAILDETVVSKGIITYETSGRLTCEYTEPEALVLSKEANGNLTVTKKGKPVPPSIMHRQMMDMMEMFVSGKAVGKADEYKVEVWADGNAYIIVLTPKAKGRFSEIELHLGKDSKRMEKTVLKEAKGDITTVTMTE